MDEGVQYIPMSQKTKIMKKVHREIRKQKPALLNQIARGAVDGSAAGTDQPCAARIDAGRVEGFMTGP